MATDDFKCPVYIFHRNSMNNLSSELYYESPLVYVEKSFNLLNNIFLFKSKEEFYIKKIALSSRLNRLIVLYSNHNGKTFCCIYQCALVSRNIVNFEYICTVTNFQDKEIRDFEFYYCLRKQEESIVFYWSNDLISKAYVNSDWQIKFN